MVHTVYHHKWQGRTRSRVSVPGIGAALALAMAAFLLLAIPSVHAGPNSDLEIVYLDAEGVIRVIDPYPPSDGLAVTWFSPTAGWTSFALGDVTGDGDDEIVAIRRDGAGGRLTVFDPVALSAPPESIRLHDGVPWAVLYDVALPSVPALVAMGNFDPDRPGQEILYSLQPGTGEGQSSQNTHRFVVLRQPQGVTNGTQWEVQTIWETPNAWTWMATGNVDGVGPDEVALVDDQVGTLSVYRVGQGFNRIFTHSSGSFTWRGATFAQYIPGGPLELAAVRSAPLGLASLWVFRYENNTFVDHFGDIHVPSPEFIFTADIGGNGDDELVLLRSVPQEVSGRPRLWIRDNGNDPIGMPQALLDGDNGYRVGDGGDVDGDGRDELVIMRNNRIRVYTSPNQGAEFIEFAVATDSHTIRLGNLDAGGLGPRPRLGTVPEELIWDLDPGVAGAPLNVTVRDVAQGTAVAVRAETRDAPWARLVQTTGVTPATFHVEVASEDLEPGVYVGELAVTAQVGSVDNSPALVPMTLTVASPVSLQPQSLGFIYYPCEDSPDTRRAEIEVSGPPVPLRAFFEGDVTWATVTPDSGQVPLTLVVEVDPSARESDVEQATLVVSYDLPNSVDNRLMVPTILVCTNIRQMLPMLSVE